MASVSLTMPGDMVFSVEAALAEFTARSHTDSKKTAVNSESS